MARELVVGVIAHQCPVREHAPQRELDAREARLQTLGALVHGVLELGDVRLHARRVRDEVLLARLAEHRRLRSAQPAQRDRQQHAPDQRQHRGAAAAIATSRVPSATRARQKLASGQGAVVPVPACAIRREDPGAVGALPDARLGDVSSGVFGERGRGGSIVNIGLWVLYGRFRGSLRSGSSPPRMSCRQHAKAFRRCQEQRFAWCC